MRGSHLLTMCVLVPSAVVACSEDQAWHNTDPQFVGTWTTGCADASTGDPRRAAYMLTLEFTLTQYTGTLGYYLDGAVRTRCSSSARPASTASVGPRR